MRVHKHAITSCAQAGRLPHYTMDQHVCLQRFNERFLQGMYLQPTYALTLLLCIAARRREYRTFES